MRLALSIVLAAGLALADDEWATGIGQAEAVNRGLVGYWSMRLVGTQHVAEAGAPNMNSGTAVQSTLPAHGIVGVGVILTNIATGNGIGPTTETLITNASPFSMSLWFSFGADVDFTVVAGMFNGTRGWLIDQNATLSSGLRWRNLASPSNLTATVPMANTATGEWHHVAMVSDATNIFFWVDGAYSTGIVDSINGVTNTLYVGYRPDSISAGDDNGGRRDEIRYYNVALTSNEVRRLYLAGQLLRGVK